MRKVLFTVALFFTACAVSAQESVVKEAKSAKSNPEEAAKLTDPDYQKRVAFVLAESINEYLGGEGS